MVNPETTRTRHSPRVTALLKAAMICASIRDGENSFTPGSKTDLGIRIGADACLTAILAEVGALPNGAMALMDRAAAQNGGSLQEQSNA